MNENAITAQFAALFEGRTDAYGTDGGGCRKAPVTPDLFRRHLDGVEPIGIYPMVKRGVWCVHWGCVDIDEGVDMLVLARNLWRALGILGITSWVERSRSKGFHVWVFADGWVTAVDMRNALLLACQVAGVKPKEVNPKSVALADDQTVGNYVRCPYPNRGLLGRQVVVDPTTDVPMSLQGFLESASAQRNTVQKIADVAAMYVPPPPPKPVVVAEYDGNLKEVTDKLTPLAWTVFTEGPMEGSDRSSTLGRLAHLCRESTLTGGETLAVLVDADGRWGKFSGRPDGLAQLEKLVRWAYQ